MHGIRRLSGTIMNTSSPSVRILSRPGRHGSSRRFPAGVTSSEYRTDFATGSDDCNRQCKAVTIRATVSVGMLERPVGNPVSVSIGCDSDSASQFCHELVLHSSGIPRSAIRLRPGAIRSAASTYGPAEGSCRHEFDTFAGQEADGVSGLPRSILS